LHEVTEPLKRLQHDEQRQARARLAGSVDGEDQLVRRGRKGVQKLGLVHQWGNPGSKSLTFLAFNINPEGVPAVVPETPAKP